MIRLITGDRQKNRVMIAHMGTHQHVRWEIRAILRLPHSELAHSPRGRNVEGMYDPGTKRNLSKAEPVAKVGASGSTSSMMLPV